VSRQNEILIKKRLCLEISKEESKEKWELKIDKD